MIVYAKHEPDHRIGKVVADMRRLGPPTLRAVFYDDDFFALEGSQRLAAADYLGLCPRLLIEPLDVAADALREFWLKAKDRLPFYCFPIMTAMWPLGESPEAWYGSFGT